MDPRCLTYDDSGHCELAPVHHFVQVFDDGGQVGIYCIYCDYILFEHLSSTYVTPKGDLIDQMREGTCQEPRGD
jgi:hypothetical protein